MLFLPFLQGSNVSISDKKVLGFPIASLGYYDFHGLQTVGHKPKGDSQTVRPAEIFMLLQERSACFAPVT